MKYHILNAVSKFIFNAVSKLEKEAKVAYLMILVYALILLVKMESFIKRRHP